jgi:hypothetical protein
VKKEPKELAAYQDKDRYIKALKVEVTNQPSEIQNGYNAVLDGVVHCNNHKSYPFWRTMLTSTLENNYRTNVFQNTKEVKIGKIVISTVTT